jgi:hypothetical protein
MPIVLKTEEWDTAGIRYMQPKVNDRGGKSIAIISTQSGRSLHISTPLMMTWGIADYVNENGESDGKFKMSLNFPNADYKSEATDQFLSKIKAFENQILDDAVKYSDAWFGEELSREVVKHNLFPFLKYPKDKLTKNLIIIDLLQLAQLYLIMEENGRQRFMILHQTYCFQAMKNPV